MPELRWILLAAGIVIILALWWRESKRPSAQAGSEAPGEAEPPEAPAEAAPDELEQTEDEPGERQLPGDATDTALPEIHALRPGRGDFLRRHPPVVEIPADAEPELADTSVPEDLPPLVPYREIGEALANLPELRASRRPSSEQFEDTQPWIRTQPLDRDELAQSQAEPEELTEPEVPAEPAEAPAEPAEQPTAAGTQASSAGRQRPAPPLSREEAAARQQAAEAAAEKRRIVALRLIAAGGRWAGPSVIAALEAEGLTYGKYSIFHRERDDGRSIFYVASMVEPGSFQLERIESQTFPGISIFSVIPGPVDAPTTFDLMLATGRRLAERLSGQLQDEQGSTLTAQRVLSMREELAHFEHVSRRARSR